MEVISRSHIVILLCLVYYQPICFTKFVNTLFAWQQGPTWKLCYFGLCLSTIFLLCFLFFSFLHYYELVSWISFPKTVWNKKYWKYCVHLCWIFSNSNKRIDYSNYFVWTGFFLTKIFHPNVAKSGEICVNTLKKDWKPDLGLQHILLVSLHHTYPGTQRFSWIPHTNELTHKVAVWV